MLETTWHLDLDDRRCEVLLPEWSRDIVSQYRWHFDHVNGNIESALGVPLRDLVVNAPAGSEVTVSYEIAIAHAGQLGIWDWRTLRLIHRNGKGFCLSRYRYVYREPSGVWGLWLPVEGVLRYFGAFNNEDEAGRAANYLGPRWCGLAFQGETVCGALEGGAAYQAPRPAAKIASPASGEREVVCRIEWADGRVEIIDPADLA